MKKLFVIPALFIALFSALTLGAQAPASETSNFQEFLSQFPKAELPYSLTAESLKGQLEKPAAGRAKRLAWDFYQFLPDLEKSAQYSNMPVYPEPIAAFETADHYAVLYNIARGVSKNNKTFTITVFTKDGQYVATNCVASMNPKALTAAVIKTNLTATVTEYTVNWANNYMETGIEGNSITNLVKNADQTIDLTVPGSGDEIKWSATDNGQTASNLASAK